MLSLIIANDKKIKSGLELIDWAFNRKLLGDHQINFNEKGKYRPHELGQHITRVSFKKGCFKGQEIIARMEYLGKLKKETRLIVYSKKRKYQNLQLLEKHTKIKISFFHRVLAI